jgi:tetratricopeptide (TPR) repeat protein
LSFRSGNSRDLALLFAGGLESVGIPAAFVQIEEDFLVAVSLNVNQIAAETLFNGTGKVLVIDNEVWLPLSMNAFNEGFTAAWALGVKVLNETFGSGKHADFVLVEEAWASYPPAPFPEQGGSVVRTDANAAAREVNRAVQQYIDSEITPILRQVQTQINENPTAALYNRLGIVQVRAGRIAEGKANYERAAGMGSVPAMTNRGNLALSENDYATAERWFRQALARDNQNSAALRGLEQVEEKK